MGKATMTQKDMENLARIRELSLELGQLCSTLVIGGHYKFEGEGDEGVFHVTKAGNDLVALGMTHLLLDGIKKDVQECFMGKGPAVENNGSDKENTDA